MTEKPFLRQHALLQININGIDTHVGPSDVEPRRQEERGGPERAGQGIGEKERQQMGRIPKYCLLHKQAKRHQVDLVTFQEHHKKSFIDMQRLDYAWGQKGWRTLWNLETTKRETGRGVGCLWSEKNWTYVNSYSISPRLLFVELQDADGTCITLCSAHFHHDPPKRRQQWRLMPKVQGHFLIGADHNSLLNRATDSRVAATESLTTQDARSEELARYADLGISDCWEEQFEGEEDRGRGGENPRGYTRGDRRIDRVSASRGVQRAVAAVYTAPVAYSDHRAVIARVTAVAAMQGRGRWRFPQEVLDDETASLAMLDNLHRVPEGPILQWWHDALDVLKQSSQLRPNRNAKWSSQAQELMAAVASSSTQWVTSKGWGLLAQRGLEPKTMKEAYIKLMHLKEEACLSDTRDYLTNSLTAQISTGTKNPTTARAARRQAVWKLLEQLEGRRTSAAVRDAMGHLHTAPGSIARVLRDY